MFVAFRNHLFSAIIMFRAKAFVELFYLLELQTETEQDLKEEV